MEITDLIEIWRDTADLFTDVQEQAQAAVYRDCANDLEEYLKNKERQKDEPF